MSGQRASLRCGAYVDRSVPLARSGRRHARCKRPATTTRTQRVVALAWESEREVALCAQHAAMFDQGCARLRSDDR